MRGLGLDHRAGRSASPDNQHIDPRLTLNGLRFAPFGDAFTDDFGPVFAKLLDPETEPFCERFEDALGRAPDRRSRADGASATMTVEKPAGIAFEC